MPARRLLAPALAGLVATACAGVRPKGDEAQPIVRSFRIEGAHRLSADDLKRSLATGETGRWPWSKRWRFDPVLWDEDVRRIPRIYESRGYYGSKVLDAQAERRADGVHLVIRVEEAPPTRVRTVEITGLDGVPAEIARRARDAVRLREGEVFREGEWEQAKAGVERALRDGGFAEGAAGGTVRVEIARHAADVRLEVAPGRRYRFGPLFLVTSTDRPFPVDPILADARSLLPEGAWFSQSRLAVAQRRLFDLGIFEAVDVSAAAAAPGSEQLPVVVDVREAPLVTSRVGVGAGSSPARSEARAVGEWTHRNFGGNLRVLHAEARAGWAFLPNAWDAVSATGAEPRRNGPFAWGALDFAQPRLAGEPSLSLFASTELERDLREAYTFASARLKGGVGWHASSSIDARAGWSLDLYDLSDTPLLGRGAPESAFGCGAPCRLGSLEQEITFGRRFSYRGPPSGREVTLRLREGARWLGGASSWVEAAGDARVYRPLSPRLVLAGRLAATSVLPLGRDVAPVVLRLFSGGSGMRGFGSRRLAPLLAYTSPSGRTQVAPTGGKGLLEASLEVRLDLGASIGAAAFVDAGSVTPGPFDPVLAAKALQVAPGVGLRYRSVLGPLRADVAAPLPWGPSLPVTVLPGARVDPDVARRAGRHACCAVHISLGEAF